MAWRVPAAAGSGICLSIAAAETGSEYPLGAAIAGSCRLGLKAPKRD